MMQEIELKFLVPESRLKGLMRQTKVKSSKQTHMAAYYFDTPKQLLAQAGIGLRIRLEGDTWVQTIKAGGDGIAARTEHNAILDNEQVNLMLMTDTLLPDLSLYQDTPIEPILADFNLKKLSKKLTCQYVTDVMRITRLLEGTSIIEDDSKKEDGNKTAIELAYDYGEIISGTKKRYPIQEIEFELISGEVDFLFATAKTWCKRYKLCLSTVTKAERGGLLINEQAHSPAVKTDFKHFDIDKDTSLPVFVRAAVHNCLLQILPNSSAIVAGSDDDEHILQLRIGIHRLRVALKSFKKFSEQINPEWQPILKQTQRLLGEYRDLTNLITYIEPALIEQGAPSVDWSTQIDKIKISPIDAVRANDFQLTLLELIAFTMSDASTDTKTNKLARDKLPKILSKRDSKRLKAEQDFRELSAGNSNNSDMEALHKVRRRLKDLRYLSAFAAPLYSKKKSERWLKRLKKAQKALGQYHDYSQYQQRYQQKSVTDSQALYGAGWFAAKLAKSHKRCNKRLSKVREQTPFW
nr:CYTH and CHAD domain-containing protein [uncultured Psychrobacter sp.]